MNHHLSELTPDNNARIKNISMTNVRFEQEEWTVLFTTLVDLTNLESVVMENASVADKDSKQIVEPFLPADMSTLLENNKSLHTFTLEGVEKISSEEASLFPKGASDDDDVAILISSKFGSDDDDSNSDDVPPNQVIKSEPNANDESPVPQNMHQSELMIDGSKTESDDDEAL